MADCKYDQFKATAAPSQSRTNVMFCACELCSAARKGEVFGKLERRNAWKERVKALHWTAAKAAKADPTEDGTS